MAPSRRFLPLFQPNFLRISALAYLTASLHLRASLNFSTAWSREISSVITPDSASKTLVFIALYTP